MNYSTSYIFNSVAGQSNPYLPAAPDPNQTNVFAFNSPQAPYLSENVNNGWKYQIDWYLSYDRKFGLHSINAVGVFERTEMKEYYVNSAAYSPVSTIDQYFAYSTSSGNRYGNGSESVAATQSWIGRLHYDYANRYIAEFSFRNDGRYEFAPGHKWGFFPSGSVAWNISQESFFKKALSWINNLKLRASIGSTGNLYDVNNNAISGYQYQTYYGNSNGYVVGNTYYTGIAPSVVPNANITWATTVERNFGVDFSLLNHRLSGSFDIFKNTMKNILGPRTITLPTTYGQSLADENYAQRSFHGWEYSLQWQDRIGNIAYSVYGNMGFAIDKWDKLDQDPLYAEGGAASFQNAIGHPADRIFGLKSDGLIRTQSQLDELTAAGYNYQGRKPYLGAILYKDIRGQDYSSTLDNTIDANDVVLLSNNGKPRINFGFGFNVSWNGLSLDAHFQGMTKYDRMIGVQEGGGIYQHGGSQRLYYPFWAGDVWQSDNVDAKYPRPVGQNWEESGATNSSFWLRDGSYLRLKNLNIGYSLPLEWLRKVGVSSTQVFVNGTNLLTFSKVKEFMDPEQKYYDSYPIMKTFTLGLNVKF